MKSLDEVLEAMTNEICLNSKADCWEVPVDLYGVILHYLHEYQRDKQIFAYDVAKKNLELSERNEPLTWDELKLMEGKPVWIELLGNGHWKGWDVIAGFDDDDFGDAMVTVHGDDYYFADLGKTWQAYRKERK